MAALTQALCDIPSVSGDERVIADATESALRSLGHLEVLRDRDAIVARTRLGRGRRVVLAGHLDTVPIAGNLPVRVTGSGTSQTLHGRGTVDMKGGVAVQLKLAAELTAPRHDVTYVFYDHEEVASRLNGLGRLAREHPDWLAADFAVLGEPSNQTVEGGCQGTMRVKITVPGLAAHSARSWLGRNAIHGAAAARARPGLGAPAAAELMAAVGRPAAPKLGWTDVARFAALGVPAVNFGPGDPNLAHTDHEQCPVPAIQECLRILSDWLAPRRAGR